MRIWLLGNVTVTSDRGRLTLAPRCRSVVAALALNAGQPTPLSELIRFVWDEPQLPHSPGAALHTYVSRTRQSFTITNEQDLLRTVADGYLLDIPRSDVDALCFRDRLASDRLDIPNLKDALQLWTGPSLGGVRSTTAMSAERTALDELRLGAIERLNGLRIDEGDNAALISELRQLVDRYPLREQFTLQLMTCLAHQGRRAKAFGSTSALIGSFATNSNSAGHSAAGTTPAIDCRRTRLRTGGGVGGRSGLQTHWQTGCHGAGSRGSCGCLRHSRRRRHRLR